MITASAEFKALWRKKAGRVEKTRLRYKRRYKNGAGTWTNEAAWSVLEEHEFEGIGRIQQELDPAFRSIFNVGNVTLTLPNLYNEWLETSAAPSFWAADSVATAGYRAYRTLWQIQHGYRLNDDTWEWLSVFTGIGMEPRLTGNGSTASIEVASKSHLLDRADSEEVRASDVVLENCVPATGDGSNKDFESTSTGVDHTTDIQVNAVSMDEGDDYRLSNDNELASAQNTGRLAIALATAPTAGQTVKVSLVKWLQTQLIETLLGLLFDEAGITASERSVDPITFPSGLSGSASVDIEAEWEAAGSIADFETNDKPGYIEPWPILDNFKDGDFTANPEWTKYLNIGTNSSEAVAGDPEGYFRLQVSGDLAMLGQRTPFTRSYGIYRFKLFVEQIGSSVELGWCKITFFTVTTGPSIGRGYAIRLYAFGNKCELVIVDASPAGYTVLADLGGVPSGNAIFEITLDQATREFKVYIDGVLKGTATDATHTVNEYFDISMEKSTSATVTIRITDIRSASARAVTYESEQRDLLGAPASWGVLDYAETLNGGATAYKTNVASISGGPYDGWTAINATTRAIGSALKRYYKTQITVTPALGSATLPKIDSWEANFTVTLVYISLAKHRGKCKGMVEKYIKLADYELAYLGDGTVRVRSKSTSAEPAIELTQENGIIDVLSYDGGIPHRAIRAGRVRYGGFLEYWSGVEAGASAAVQAEESEIGGEVIDEDLSDVLVALDVNMAASRARLIYENARRAATDPRPPRRLRLKTAIIPWLELGDVVNLTFFDNPYMAQFLVEDPLHRVGPYSNWGDPANVLANDQDFKVLSYAPDYGSDEDAAEMLVEELT